MKKLNQEAIKLVIAVRMAMGLLGCKGDKEASQANKTVISNSGSSTMVNLGQPAGHVKQYIDWILSPAGQEIVKKEGYVPAASVK